MSRLRSHVGQNGAVVEAMIPNTCRGEPVSDGRRRAASAGASHVAEVRLDSLSISLARDDLRRVTNAWRQLRPCIR